MPEYTVLDKDTIKSVITPCLFVAKRGCLQIQPYRDCQCHSLQIQERMPVVFSSTEASLQQETSILEYSLQPLP